MLLKSAYNIEIFHSVSLQINSFSKSNHIVSLKCEPSSYVRLIIETSQNKDLKLVS